jgi:SOS response regulatory protein OraA/RecX
MPTAQGKFNSSDLNIDDLHQLLIKKGGALLSRRSYSRGELRDKLVKIADSCFVEPVLIRLEQLHLLNDEEYAYNLAFYHIKHEVWGPVKVIDSLLRKQIAQNIVESTIERIRNEVDNRTILLEYVERLFVKKKLQKDFKGLKKIISHLRQRGFDDGSITDAVEGLFPAEIRQHFFIGE